MCKSIYSSIRVCKWFHHVSVTTGVCIVSNIVFLFQIAKNCRLRLRPRDRQQPNGDSPHYYISCQDMKLFRTMLVFMLSFLVMWSPIFIIFFVILAHNIQGHIYVSSTMFFWVVTFSLANSALNPILYSVCQFKNSWRKRCCGSVVFPVRKRPTSGWTLGIHP